jgi:hypothetical protein
MIYGEPILQTSNEVTFDPVNGIETNQQWEGSMQAVTDLATVFYASGYKVTIEERGAKGVLRVAMPTVGVGGAPETPVSKFNITTDYLDVPVWKTHSVSSRIKTLANSHSMAFEEMLCIIRSPIDAALKGKKAVLLEPAVGEYGPSLAYQTVREGPLLPSETDFAFHISNEYGAVTFMSQLYAMMARGTDSMAQEWPILKWAMTYSAQYLSRRRIPASPNVYTTTALVRDFSIPLWIAAQLPADPDSLASNSAFGWKERARDTETDSRGRVTDTVEFAFAEWSTILYTIVT